MLEMRLVHRHDRTSSHRLGAVGGPLHNLGWIDDAGTERILNTTLMPDPIISSRRDPADPSARYTATGSSFAIREWRGSGPAKLHVHHGDDEAWHVLEGTLRFRFADRVVDAGPGDTVFVPAGVPHTYEALNARYLVFLTPRLIALIEQLQQTRDPAAQASIYEAHQSTLLEP